MKSFLIDTERVRLRIVPHTGSDLVLGYCINRKLLCCFKNRYKI